MKLSQQTWVIILGIALAASIIYIIDQNSTINSLENLLENEKEKKEAVIDQNRKLEQELKNKGDKLDKSARGDTQTAKDLEEQKEQLKNEDYENEPFRINDADSLRDVIARRFNES
ncbi:hypothetical protein INR75_06580 [Zunongwangia sp. SCSIO 43204]|uniref:hypothetical protein n=1 Tax=Zunongwangia sp. SCSIO 43204 TaxID=2779359 RepID=UPI001CA84062|nr:hypothetical protein [Zunongwangia sp. SCSIO 43204]UAB85674.1 hypothetical protein INR75_06580 [Zunongwangia sp. SCSIO 43204]